MATTPQKPVVMKALPPIVTNEGSPCGPLDLKEYIESPNPANDGEVRFYAKLPGDVSLPKGLICTTDGLLGGMSMQGTAGTYQINLTAENDCPEPIGVIISLTINEALAAEDPGQTRKLKQDAWDALGKDMPIPEMTDALSRPVTAEEVYYLMQRFAVMSIWDVYNLEPAGDKTLLTLTGASPHYNIYDRGSCLVGAPKDLFSHQRTLADALQTAKAMAREVYKRGWTIEFSGFNKMVRAAWIELRVMGEKTGKQLEVLHYTPSLEDMKVYSAESRAVRPSI
jgi:hypothetical protein